jgi:hypothetical protein
MSNADLVDALDAARADEVLERARDVIAAQDAIIAALREALDRAMSPDTAVKVDEIVNRRYGGDCIVSEAVKIAFEVAGIPAALALAR